MSFYLIGIGGAGMSVVAELLHAKGEVVCGSDAKDSKNLDHLRSLGIEVFVGHDAAHVPADARVVISTAVRESNPELAIARERGQEVLHRSQALALAAKGLDFVAVAGAHGKTTSSGMLAAALSQAGMDPSFAVGGVVTGFDTGAHLGASSVFVAEADESDKSFLNYSPRVALVTNVEPDHLDNYGSREEFEQTFLKFAQKIVPSGLLIVCSDDEGAARLGRAYEELGGRVWSYGGLTEDEGLWRGQKHAVVSAANLAPAHASATVCFDGQETELSLNVGGAHNLENATGALLVGIELGVPMERMATALHSFKGTGRRFELRGKAQGKVLVDDYAHHPSEVAAALRQARVESGGGRVLVLFQPHLYSRTKTFATEFAKAFQLADRLYITDIFGAREDPVEGVTSQLISNQVPGAHYIPDMREAAQAIANEAREGDLVITMGAGSITSMGEVILNRWGASK